MSVSPHREVSNMLSRYIVLASVLCGLQIAAADPPTPSGTSELRNDSLRAVLTNFQSVLAYAGKSGRIYYHAICAPDDNNFPLRFPSIQVQQPVETGTDLAMVRSIFRLERDVTVAEDTPGIIRIRIGRVPDAILRIRLSTLKLTPMEQYDSWEAISAIQNASEVRSAMQKLHIVVPDRVVIMPFARPREGAPHLPPELSNVTMDQALDMVARTWGGVVSYGACSEPDTYEIFGPPVTIP